MKYCPYCHSTTIGRVGFNQYYCWNCYYEFAIKEHAIQRFRIVEDGSLTEAEVLCAKE